MTAFLPPNLLALFAPRDPLPFRPPVEKLPHEKRAIVEKNDVSNYTGIAQYCHLFEDPIDTPAPVKVRKKTKKKRSRMVY